MYTALAIYYALLADIHIIPEYHFQLLPCLDKLQVVQAFVFSTCIQMVAIATVCKDFILTILYTIM